MRGRLLLYCTWILDELDYATYSTSCNQEFVLVGGTLHSNDMKFCCYCGKKLKEERK